MGDKANPGTSKTLQADIKKVVEEALKGLPGFLALLEAAQNFTRPVEEDDRPQGGDQPSREVAR